MAEEHEGAGEHLHLVDGVVRQVSQAVCGQAGRTGEEAREAGEFAKGHPRRGEAALAFGEESAVPVDHFHADRARVRVAVHEVARAAQRLAGHDRVGVQKQHVAPSREADRLIVRLGKARIVCVFDEVYLGEKWAQIVDRPVRRSVVHHPRLHLNALRGLTDGAQTLLEQVLHIVIDDNDGEQHGGGGNRLGGGINPPSAARTCGDRGSRPEPHRPYSYGSRPGRWGRQRRLRPYAHAC